MLSRIMLKNYNEIINVVIYCLNKVFHSNMNLKSLKINKFFSNTFYLVPNMVSVLTMIMGNLVLDFQNMCIKWKVFNYKIICNFWDLQSLAFLTFSVINTRSRYYLHWVIFQFILFIVHILPIHRLSNLIIVQKCYIDCRF